ncbi:hypothetical protein ABBQ38_014970 [Trebouxia sp. C0009 RCD-2024]
MCHAAAKTTIDKATFEDDASLQRLADGHVQCSAADAWLSSLTPAVTDVERSFMCGDPSTQAQKQRSQHALLVPHTDTVESKLTDAQPGSAYRRWAWLVASA